jgi:hypothetical protein
MRIQASHGEVSVVASPHANRSFTAVTHSIIPDSYDNFGPVCWPTRPAAALYPRSPVQTGNVCRPC